VSTISPQRNTLSIVVPLYNEEAVVPTLIEQLEAFRRDRPYVVEVVLVDDGSTDRTATLVRELTVGKSGYLLLSYSRNFGHQLAITGGLHVASADAAVVMDADLQDPLEVVDDMVRRWRDGYDVVYGVRRARSGDSRVKSFLRHGFYRFFQRFTELDAPLDVGDFRLMSRPVLDAFEEIQEQQPYVRGLVSWLGFNQIGVEYDRPARAAGSSKYPMRKLSRLAADGLTSFSNKPLRYAVRIGLVTSVLSVAGLFWAVITKLLQPETISGWASIIFVAFFFGGLQLFFLGVVGAYLGRVYDEVKSRPRFVISDLWTSDDPAEDQTASPDAPSPNPSPRPGYKTD
jgi:dolichol-phosphate mannosyltransferase